MCFASSIVYNYSSMRSMKLLFFIKISWTYANSSTFIVISGRKATMKPYQLSSYGDLVGSPEPLKYNLPLDTGSPRRDHVRVVVAYLYI